MPQKGGSAMKYIKDINVISVNPAKKSLGALHPELLGRMMKSCRIPKKIVSASGFSPIVNFIFGINKSVTTGWSGKLFVIRLLVSAYLIFNGIGSAPDFSAFNIAGVQIILGGMLFLGLFARIASIASAGIFGWNAISFLASAPEAAVMPDTSLILSAVLCVIAAITGPGRFSIDQLIRRSLVRAAKKRAIVQRRRKRRITSEERMCYKAFQVLQ